MKPSIDQVLTNSFGRFGRSRRLRVALGDLDQGDAEIARERRPACGWSAGVSMPLRSAHREVEQRLLDEVRHEPGIRAVIDDGGRRAAASAARPSFSMSSRVRKLRALAHGRASGCRTRPARARSRCRRRALPCQRAPLDEVEARDVDRQVEQQVAAPAGDARSIALEGARLQVAVDELRMVLAARRRDPVRSASSTVSPSSGKGQVPAQQRQHGLADAAAADHQHASAELDRRRHGHDPAASSAATSLNCIRRASSSNASRSARAASFDPDRPIRANVRPQPMTRSAHGNRSSLV